MFEDNRSDARKKADGLFLGKSNLSAHKNRLAEQEAALADLRADKARLELLDKRLQNGFTLEVYFDSHTGRFAEYELVHPDGYDDMNHEGETLRELADDVLDAWYLKDGLPSDKGDHAMQEAQDDKHPPPYPTRTYTKEELDEIIRMNK